VQVCRCRRFTGRFSFTFLLLCHRKRNHEKK
jgi:hypothetical protein